MKFNRIVCGFVLVCVVISLTFCFVIVKARKSNEVLFDKVIYVDAGHGGKDNGASFDGVLEDEINLKISNYVVEILIDYGAYVLTSRTSDYDLSNMYDKNKKRKDLINRTRLINNSKADLFVSIHLNSFPSTSVMGSQVFYQNNERSKKLANSIQNQLNELMNSKKRVIKKGDYYILNKTNTLGVLVECGFLSNALERANLIQEDYQRKIAYKIVRGMIEYLNNLSN